jgi:hypothetical protein
MTTIIGHRYVLMCFLKKRLFSTKNHCLCRVMRRHLQNAGIKGEAQRPKTSKFGKTITQFSAPEEERRSFLGRNGVISYPISLHTFLLHHRDHPQIFSTLPHFRVSTYHICLFCGVLILYKQKGCLINWVY